MNKPPKKECPYLPNRCTASIRTEDKSCYDVCSVYKDWDTVISKHIDSFDVTPFNAKEAIKELNAIDDITHRLDYWLNNYVQPLYTWVSKTNVNRKDEKDLISYQNKLKYWKHPFSETKNKEGENSYDLLHGNLYIPRIVYNNCFKDHVEKSEFLFWLLKHNAKGFFNIILKRDHWFQKLTSPNLAYSYIQAELKELNSNENKAKELLLKKELDPYTDENTSNSTHSETIELLRILDGNYYKNNALSYSIKFKTTRLYANHIYLKQFLLDNIGKVPLQTIENNFNTTSTEQKETNKTLTILEEWLFEFRNDMTTQDYDTLTSALHEFFTTGTFPVLYNPIHINATNKKLVGWNLSRIYRTIKPNENLSYSYLLFAKKHLSIFKGNKLPKENFRKSTFYKYFVTNPHKK
jgi:hypothetical protein